MMQARELAAIGDAVARHDFLRRSVGQREWLHFCVNGPGVEAIVNFSLADEPRRGGERARLTVLVHAGGRWDGDVDEIDPERLVLRGGDLFAAWGPNRIELRDGVFELDVRLARRPIALRLRVRPQTFPSFASNAQVGSGVIHWVVVPRAVASGQVAVGDTAWPLEEALAYHDHNWGRFEHRALRWVWGHASSEDRAHPWSIVVARIFDPGETTIFTQVVMLWDGARTCRVFRGAEVAIEREGLLRPTSVLVVPRVASVAQRGATDVPRRLHVEASGDGDEVRATFDADHVARIAVPDDHGVRSTSIHEVLGCLSVTGRVRGRPVELRSRAMFELVGRGA